MPGTTGRSGGLNRKPGECLPGDGRPEPPRRLSAQAQANFDWLLERMPTEDNAGLRRIDGTVLAAAAELLESQETLAELLAADPTNEKYLRLRLQYSQQVGRFSAILGWTAKDRQTQPQAGAGEAGQATDPVAYMLARMSKHRVT